MIEGMKKALFILALLLCPWSALGQAFGAIQGLAFLGGTKAVTQGASSTNYLNGIIPHATITVYITGTTTKATIYADGSSTPLANPFYANALGATNPGGWVFWTATNAGVDVIGSGGIAPNTYPAPVSLCVDCFPSSQFIAPGVVTIVGANGPITCTGGSCDITGQSTVLQHNGTNLPSQSLLNFLDAAPSLPSGDTPVTFTTNSGGGIGGYVPPVSLGSSLAMGVTPPVSGQYAIVYPTSSSTSNCGSGLIGANNTSGFIDYNYGGSGGCPATITYTFGALPSYILAANVTAVYGFTVASSQPLVASNIASVSMVCGPVSSIIVSSNAIIPINQYTSGGSIMTGAQVSGSICTATANGSVIGAKSVNFDIKSVGLIVYYTGSAPPANTNILVEAPLYFNPSSLTLGITLPFDVGLDTGSTNALAASVAGYNLTFGQRITLAAAHNTSSITPTFALNGLSALTIVGPTGGALTSGDINTTVPAILMYGTNGSTGLWYLQNPQVSGGGGGVTSINSNAGAFTFSGSGVSCTGTTCTFSGSGSGLTSLNGLTGPALNLTSSDSSVTITPGGTSINLQATGGGGGSPAGSNYATQYNNGGSFGGTGPGTSGYVLTSNGSSAAPTYQPSSGGGTTTNALTANSSGGAAPGTTFNGSAARTFDYHSFGAAGISGTPTTGHCADWASATTLGDTGAACGSSLSLTTTGTSGAATYLGNIINIPQYQGAITLTTTGTSGAATLAGNTLNIPQYTGGVASINSQTGPAINIHSSDASVTVTTTTNDINLQVSGGSGCTATGAAGVAIVTDGSGHCIPATGSVSTGTGGTAAGVTLPEGTALTPTAGYDILNTNSSTHTLDLSTNGGAFSHVCTAANGYCAAASAGPQFKQYTYVADSTAASVTSPSLTIAAGDLLVVSCRFATSTGSTGIATDSHSNSYSALAAQVNSPQAVGIQASWAIASASGATTFTCTQGGSAAGISLIALDYSNGTGTTVNTSSGGILSSFQTRITSPSYATSQRTLNVFCSAVNSISGFFDPLWIGGNSAQLVGASAAGVEIVGADQGCESIAIPYAVPGATANMQYSVSIYAAQTAVAFNY